MNSCYHVYERFLIIFLPSALQGYQVKVLRPINTSEASHFFLDESRKRHFTLTAETHNFPTGRSP